MSSDRVKVGKSWIRWLKVGEQKWRQFNNRSEHNWRAIWPVSRNICKNGSGALSIEHELVN